MAKLIVSGQRVTAYKVRRAKELRRNMTWEEKVLWQQLRNHRIEGLQFRRQQIIDGFIVDFYCHEANLVVEVDGASHDATQAYDAERSAVLARRGLQVLRIHNDEVRYHLPDVIARIRQRCRERRGLPGS